MIEFKDIDEFDQNTAKLISVLFDEIGLLQLENDKIGMFELFNQNLVSKDVLNFLERLSDVVI